MWHWWVALTCVCLWQVGASAQQVVADSVAYLPKSGYYLIYQRDSVGGWELRELLTSEEYFRATAMGQGATYFYQKGQAPPPVSLSVKPRLGLVARGFLSLNINNTVTEEDNPLLPVAMHRRSHFMVEPTINIHLKANYTDRLQLDLSYNTEAAMADRRSRVRLRYEGEQFDLVERLEAGNVRMESRNPLIDTGGDLFGVKGQFRLGPFSWQVVASRQYAEERKIVVQGGRQLRQTELRGSDYDFAQHFFLSEFFAAHYSEALRELPLVRSDLFIDRLEVWVTTPRQLEVSGNAEPIILYEGASLAEEPPQSSLFEGEGRRVASAYRLPESAYTFHPTLGFVSLHTPLGDGQVLAVAYSYRYRGVRYEVGDLSVDEGERRVALLSDQDRSPLSPLWGLMMKNGYTLNGARGGSTKEGLKVQLVYRDVASGIDQPLVERGEERGRSWLDLFGWDKADASGRGGLPDGLFDLVEGVTYQPSSGTLFLPQRYPFVEVPNGEYPTYPSLYGKSKREAKEERERDLFRIRAEVSGSVAQVVSLGYGTIEPGSVRVESGGRMLTEGVEYVVDYLSGTLTLTSNSVESVEITVKERERHRRKEKSLIGAELNWSPMPRLNIGGSMLAYWEDSRRNRIRWGEEVLRNRMWGLHGHYSLENGSVVEWLNGWSGLDLKEPFRLSLQASYAELLSDYNHSKSGSDRIVIEDFEQGNRYIELTYPERWSLGHVERPERRGQMAWFAIDPLLVRDGARYQPLHLREDEAQRRGPLVREVWQEEFFPKRDLSPVMRQSVPMLNLSFYPEERGPYNPQAPGLPEEMWGSICYPLGVNDLESQRYSYIELWLLDPFALDAEAAEGVMLLDLGRIKEEILPDGGLSHEGSQPKVETAWGKRATELPQMYGFETSGSVSIEAQDIGLDGMSSEVEGQHVRYRAFANEPDPAKDDYRFFLGEEWDEQKASIIERHRYINGMEGNSIPREVQGVQSARTWQPDSEDFNRDMLQEQSEGYLRYKVPISRATLSGEMVVGEKYLGDRERWVKLRIPLDRPDSEVGERVSLQDVRTLRLSLTGFAREAQLRLAQFRLVSTSWAEYQSSIEATDRRGAMVRVSRLSMEEDGQREPIPYLSPPEVERDEVAMDWALRSEDEQALSLTVEELEPGQPVALYQEFSLDLRHYRELEMWSHLESQYPLSAGDVELFIRLGQDFTANFYEYRLPLEPTPHADYSVMEEQVARAEIWRSANKVSLSLEALTQLKEERERSNGDVGSPFVRPYPAQKGGEIVVQGHPSLGRITSVLIGIRNRSQRTIVAELWVNELSVRGARAVGGRAAQGVVQAHLGELGSIYLDGQYRSAGFGSITSDSRKKELMDRESMLLRAELQLGLLMPRKWRLKAPLRYTMERHKATPLYNPYNNDLLNEGLGATFRQLESVELTDMRWLPDRGGKVTPWSLSNWLFRYRLDRQRGYSPEVVEERERRSQSELTYQFDTSPQSFIRFNSLWDRQFRYLAFPSASSSLSTLQSRWDWVRGLLIRQSYKGFTFSLQSTTQALVEEPFERWHREGEEHLFRWLTKEIVRDIATLGSTQSYFGQVELSYRLPSFTPKLWKPLSGQMTWRSNYQWQLGARGSQYQLGNRAENGSYLDLIGRYHFALLPTKVLEELSIHFRRRTGSSLPGLLAGGGKLFGVDFIDRQLAPSLAFRLGLDRPMDTFSKVQERHWITQEGGATQPLTTFWHNEMEINLSLTPLKGVELLLSYENSRQHHTSMTPYQSDKGVLERGSIRYSTIATLSQTPSIDGFARQASLLYIEGNGLPNPLATLPNWQLTLHANRWLPKLSEYLPTLRLTHRYRSYLEVPTYYIHYGTKELQSIVVSQNLNPLIGVEVQTKWGVTLEERYNRRRTQTLKQSAQQILEQSDKELYSRLGYRVTFDPLFTSKWSLLRSHQQSLQLQLHHTYTYTLLRQWRGDIDGGALQGVKSHTLQLSAEYGLSDAISLRAYVERQQRQPLVANYTFPYRRTTYGILLRLQLQP